MPILNPVSTQPNGVMLTNAALAAVSVVTTTENTVVQTLGGTSAGDGDGGLFYFVGGSSRPIDGVTCLGTPTTGRWVSASNTQTFSGVTISASMTGIAETFVILSGFAPVVYTLPPSTNILGETITVRTQTTGTATIRTSGTDLLFYTSKTSPVLSVASLTSTLTGGYVWNFKATSGAYYGIDQFNGAKYGGRFLFRRCFGLLP